MSLTQEDLQRYMMTVSIGLSHAAEQFRGYGEALLKSADAFQALVDEMKDMAQPPEPAADEPDDDIDGYPEPYEDYDDYFDADDYPYDFNPYED